MGNTESSSSQFPPYNNQQLSSRRSQSPSYAEDDEDNSCNRRLKVVAGVAGTALFAYGAFKLMNSDDSTDLRRCHHEQIHDWNNRENNNDTRGLGIIKVMSYNVWFREDVEVVERMKAIGGLIMQHKPQIIFFQEVTPNIYDIFQKTNWWKAYNCSVEPQQATRRYFCMLLSKLQVDGFGVVPFRGSTMGRELCAAQINVGRGRKLIVATSHLESPEPPVMHSTERISQAKEALKLLNSSTDAVFGGDMNWDEYSDGPFPILQGWVDAWTDLKAGENGWTYDTKSNVMLTGNRPLQKRLDRFVCKLHNFELLEIEMIGKDAIQGISYINKNKRPPVLPSDHYGLILSLGAKY